MYLEKMQATDITAVRQMIGRMQDKIEKQEELLKEMSREMEELQQLLNDKKDTEPNPEAQPAGQKDSLDKIYEIISGMDKYTTEEVLFSAAEILCDLMGTEDVAIYNVANRDYARLFSATSAEARKMGNSIKYTALGEMYDELKNKQVYINHTMNTDFPCMAGAVYTGNEMRLILMFWGIPTQRFNTSEANRLTAIGTLIQNAILRTSHYLESSRSQRYMEGSNVLNEEAFTALFRIFLNARAKGLTDCTLLEVMTGYQDYEEVSPLLTCNIRLTDYMGLMESKNLYILLCNTDSKNAEVVQERLQKLGYDSVIKEDI